MIFCKHIGLKKLINSVYKNSALNFIVKNSKPNSKVIQKECSQHYLIYNCPPFNDGS